MLKNPGIINALSAKLAARVRQMTFQRSLLSLPNIAQRVCCQLWLLIPEKERDGGLTSGRDANKSKPAENAEMAVIANPPTHMEMAIMLNVSRETVTRVFQSLQSRTIVKRDGPSKLLVIDLRVLKNLAEGAEELA